MSDLNILTEGRRLHALGFAIHWLYPKDKRPIDTGWTTGPRKTWEALEKQYKPGMNVGVRLGTPSRIGDGYLYVVDCDVKGKEPRHQDEMRSKLYKLFPGIVCPIVKSGRGNGSMHLYVRTKEVIREKRLASSSDRIGRKHAWEIVLMGEGRQVVLPPSIHPESGLKYEWDSPLVEVEDIPFIEIQDLDAGSAQNEQKSADRTPRHDFKFEVVDVDVDKIPAPVMAKLQGEGMGADDSALLYGVICALVKEGFTDVEIMTVLTDRLFELSDVAYRHRQTSDRTNAAHWLKTQNIDKARKKALDTEYFEKEVEVTTLDDIAVEEQQKEMVGETEVRKTNLVYENYDDIEADTGTAALVRGLLDHNTAAVVYGDTNSGKTFFMLDLALHIAQGKEWQNRKTEESAVVYVAAEGGRRIKDRIVAFRKAHPSKKGAVNFTLARGNINLLSSNDVVPFLSDIKTIEEKKKRPVRLVVIDTLSRAISGGDENDSKDMGAFIKNVDIIREKTGAAVIAVHHTGKDKAKGARGHSSLKGAVDTEIEVKLFDEKKHPGIKAAFVRKQRDFDYCNPMGFKLKQVEVAKDDQGDMITSCIVEPVNLDAIQFDSIETPGLSERAQQALDILLSIFRLHEGDVVDETMWYHDFRKSHFDSKSRQAAHKSFLAAKDELLSLNRIKIDATKSVSLTKR